MKLTWKCLSSNISPLKKFGFKFLVSRINKLQGVWIVSGKVGKEITLNNLNKSLKINDVLIFVGFHYTIAV